MPSVEVGPYDDDFIGKIAASDLCDDVVNLCGGADAILEGELDRDGAFFEEAFDEELVFEADLGDGNFDRPPPMARLSAFWVPLALPVRSTACGVKVPRRVRALIRSPIAGCSPKLPLSTRAMLPASLSFMASSFSRGRSWGM